MSQFDVSNLPTDISDWIAKHSQDEIVLILRLGIKLFHQIEQAKLPDCVQDQMRVGVKMLQDEIKSTFSDPLQFNIAELNTKLGKMIHTVTTSATKGNLGEELVMNNISQQFPGVEIINTSKIPHSGDFHVLFFPVNSSKSGDKRKIPTPYMRVMVDVNTRATNVPSSEVERFDSDLETCKDVDAGILVATTSGIACVPAMKIVSSCNNKLAILLPKSEPSGGLAINFALQFCTAWKETRNVLSEGKSAEPLTPDQSKILLNNLESQMKEILEKYDTIKLSSQDIDQEIKQFNKVLTNLNSISLRLRNDMSQLESFHLAQLSKSINTFCNA